MRTFKRILLGLLLLLVMLFGILFSIQNSDRASLDLLVLQLPEQRVSLWVLAAFALGGMIGMLLSMSAILRLKSRLLIAENRLQRREKELSQAGTALRISKSGKP